MGLKDIVASHLPIKVFVHKWVSGTSTWDAWDGTTDAASAALLSTIDADTSTLALHPYSIKQTPTEATGSAALATTIAPGYAWELIGFTLHTSAVGASGTLTLTVDGATAGYDPVLLSVDMTAVQDYPYFPAVPIPFKSGDELDFAWANAGAKTFYLTIWYARRYGDVA